MLLKNLFAYVTLLLLLLAYVNGYVCVVGLYTCELCWILSLYARPVLLAIISISNACISD